jgi:hypothetical protein
MQLKFFARGDLLVTVPGFAPVVGQPQLRVGREFVRGDESKGIPPEYPATKEPFVVDSNSPEGRRLKKLIQRDESLWAADQATAAECGVQFVELEFKDSEWLPKPAVSKPSNKGTE